MSSFSPHSFLSLSLSSFLLFSTRGSSTKLGFPCHFFDLFYIFLMDTNRLEGDQEEATYTDAGGVIRCSAHHDNWEGMKWHIEEGWTATAAWYTGTSHGYSWSQPPTRFAIVTGYVFQKILV